MRILGVLGVAMALPSADAAGVGLVFNPRLDGEIAFLPQAEELPSELLLSNKDDPDKDKIKCSQRSETYNGDVDVLLLFSSCVEDSTLLTVETWARDMKKIVADTAKQDELSLNFIASAVPGTCTATARRAMASTANTSTLLDQEASGTFMDRLGVFQTLGLVQEAEVVAQSADTLTAVVSFATDETSYNEIVAFEATAQVVNVMNFQVGSGDNCEGRYGSCIELQRDEDLFMYNPFSATNAVTCDSLENGVPVTIVGSNGKRQCFCGCPAGFELKKNGNTPVCKKVSDDCSSCVWSRVSGYRHQVRSKSSVCAFDHVVDRWGIPIPLPTSGASGSRLLADTTALDLRVSISAVRVQDPEYYAGYLISALGSASSSWPLRLKDAIARAPSVASLNKFVAGGDDLPIHDDTRTWKDYQSNRADAVNSIVFSDYGKYRLELNAFDYYSSSKCTACLVLIDSFRPQATTKCPASFCDKAVSSDTCGAKAELTMANVVRADALVKQHAAFGDQADNDGCGGNNRCDLHQYSKLDFFESKYTRYSPDESSSCFDPDEVLSDLLSDPKTAVNPLERSDGGCHDVQNPVPAGQCTRCCKMTTALREFWTDYRCGSDYDARYCEGDSDQTCTFEQCLVMNGDTLAAVSAEIKPAVVAESERVVKQLKESSYQTVTQVHRALQCSAFYSTDGECVFKAKLSQLIDTTQQLNFAGGLEADSYVYWRFKVNGDAEKWQLWKTRRESDTVYDRDDELTFADPETKISIEAWTQCGLVRRFFFYVHLHVTSLVDVCSQFSDMWYQTTVSRLPIASQMCAYPGSDFAELTFDFHPTAGLQYSRASLPMKASAVVCTGALENRSPAQLLKVTKESPEIVTRFAVELIHRPTTEALSTFNVSCDFMYVDYSGSSRTKTCGHSFSIGDCKGPLFDPPHARCAYDTCAGNEKAGLYEVCGGTVVRSTATETYVEVGDKQCCQGCQETSVECKSILSVPGKDPELMRCEPGNVSGDYQYYPVSMLAKATEDHPMIVMLLCGGVVAALALVITRLRNHVPRTVQFEDPDSTYPLLYH